MENVALPGGAVGQVNRNVDGQESSWVAETMRSVEASISTPP